MIKKVIQFFKEVRFELTKVAWPNRQELVGSTIVVIIMSVILSIFIGGVDFGLSRLIQFIMK